MQLQKSYDKHKKQLRGAGNVTTTYLLKTQQSSVSLELCLGNLKQRTRDNYDVTVLEKLPFSWLVQA